MECEIMLSLSDISSMIFFVLGFFYSFYFYRISKKKYEISIFVDSEYNSNNVLYFIIWNSGNETIYREDILNASKQIEVTFKEGFGIEYAKVDQVTSNYIGLEIKNNYNSMHIKFDVLRPDEGLAIKIKPHIKLRSFWKLEIKQQRDIFSFPNRIKTRGKSSNIILGSNLLSYISLFLTMLNIYFFQQINFKELNSLLD